MKLFDGIKKNESSSLTESIFDKNHVIKEILENRAEICPEWLFFKMSNEDDYTHVNGDFIAIYTDSINRQINIQGNPYSEYKRIVPFTCQIVREIHITDDEIDDDFVAIYKIINARSSKELFKKLKNEIGSY